MRKQILAMRNQILYGRHWTLEGVVDFSNFL